jgi:hypothetical protein
MKDAPTQDKGDRQLKIVIGILAFLELLGFVALITKWLFS